jgi:hypothetical protein
MMSFELDRVVGLDVSEVWKCHDGDVDAVRDAAACELLSAWGYRVALVDGVLQVVLSSARLSPLQEEFKDEVIAGLKTLRDIGHVVVVWNALPDRYMGLSDEKPERYGPMSKENFNELYPSGVRGNRFPSGTPASAYKAVGNTSYPPEFYAVPFYLKRLGYTFNPRTKAWDR